MSSGIKPSGEAVAAMVEDVLPGVVQVRSRRGRGAVTAGIVCGLGSVGRPFGRVRYVQSDAYLAPGNSSGPLVNARGQVVGVNAMISGGLSLAVPSNTAGAWASGEPGATLRPRLGVRVRSVALSASAGRETGLVIFAVGPGGPADRSGLLVGDVLLDMAGEPIEDPASLRDALARAVSPGGAVRLRVMRGGETLEIEASFGSLQARGA